MKKIMLFLVCLGFIFPEQVNATPENLQELLKKEHGLNGDQFCNYVYRRYYFVKRLHNTMLLFLDVEDRINKNSYKTVQLDSLFDFAETIAFQDVRIQRSVDVMQQKRSLKPLFMIWEDFTGYKSIKDQIFVEEFTKEVFIISRNMLITLAAHDEFVVVPPIRINPSTEQLLNDIDTITDIIRSLSFGAAHLQETDKLREVDLHTFAHIDEVMMRYYVVKRLKNACTQLGELEYCPPVAKKNCTIVWHHPHIISYMHIMEQAQSIQPLIELWDDVLQYKYVQDDLFMHEFAQLVLCTYADILAYYQQKHSPASKDAISTALQLYQLIDKLPLNEILDVIDILTHDLPPLLEKYEFDSDISWRAWLRKYWWAPPTILATIIVQVLLNWEAKNHMIRPDPSQGAPQIPITNQLTNASNEGDYIWLDEYGIFSTF